ncbi:MAG: hypothetical protein WC683_06300 [bacterium]
MAQWFLSDGTIVRLGGEVEGGSPAAEALRDAFYWAAKGMRRVYLTEHPHSVPADLQVVWHVSSITRAVAWQHGVTVLSGPPVTPQPPPEPIPEGAIA